MRASWPTSCGICEYIVPPQHYNADMLIFDLPDLGLAQQGPAKPGKSPADHRRFRASDKYFNQPIRRRCSMADSAGSTLTRSSSLDSAHEANADQEDLHEGTSRSESCLATPSVPRPGRQGQRYVLQRAGPRRGLPTLTDFIDGVSQTWCLQPSRDLGNRRLVVIPITGVNKPQYGVLDLAHDLHCTIVPTLLIGGANEAYHATIHPPMARRHHKVTSQNGAGVTRKRANSRA